MVKNNRHFIEKRFHDAWAKSIKLNEINYKGAFEADTAVENKFALSQMGEVKGKKILDLGCGMGDASLYFASQGANVYSVDISPEMIRLVKKAAKSKKFSGEIIAKVMPAENLKFPDSYFDYVYGNGVLHHVYSGVALEEVQRVLKAGGIATFIEPLGHNPVINIYRKIAKNVRTSTEAPLLYPSLKKLTKAKFKETSHREFHLTTLLIFLWYFAIDRINPNKERYWKKIIEDSDNVKVAFRILKRLDDILFMVLPYVRRYSWNTVLVYKK